MSGTLRKLEVVQDVARTLGYKQGEEPSIQCADITPAVIVSPLIEMRSAVATNANISIALPTDRDFFLVGWSFSLIKDAVNTSVSTDIDVVVGGATQRLFRVRTLSTLAQTVNEAMSLPFPVKLDRGSTVAVTHNTTAATISASLVIYGYTRETS